MTWLINGKPVRSVLLSRLRYLGDVTMSTVLAEALRAGDPELGLGYLCEQAHGEILLDHPLLDRVHLLGIERRGADSRARVKHVSSDNGSRGIPRRTLAMVRELRGAHYDVAVDLFFNPRSAWLLWLSGIPVRIGGTRKWRQRLYTHTVLRDAVRASAPALDAIAPGGLGEHLCRLAPFTHAETGLDFLSWATEHYATETLRPHLSAPGSGPDGAPYLVLAPCATWSTKEWPAKQWTELVQSLADDQGLPLKILVPAGREDTWGGLGSGVDATRVEILPPMDLAAVKGLLASAAGVVSVDGGVMHMAVALGIPTLALFGPTDPGIWFPYETMGPFRVLAMAPDCHPCHLHQCAEFICLPELTVRQVKEAAVELFNLEPAGEEPMEREDHD